MIHILRISGRPFCGVGGDNRWIGGNWKKEDCCPTCWHGRERYWRLESRKKRDAARERRQDAHKMAVMDNGPLFE